MTGFFRNGWVEAHQAGVIAPLVLEATLHSLLDYLPLKELKKCSVEIGDVT
jgi:uncharacterized protein (DUF2237 family)